MTKRTKKILSIAGGSLLLILLLLGGAQIWLASKVRKTIEKEIAKLELGSYHLVMSDVNVRLAGRALILRDLSLTLDSLPSRDASGSYLSARFDIGRLAVKGVGSLKGGQEGKIDLRSIALGSARIAVTRHIGQAGDSLAAGNAEAPAHAAPGSIDIGSITISGSQFDYRIIRGTDTVRHELRDLNLTIGNIRKTTEEQSIQDMLGRGDIVASTEKFRYSFAQGAFELEIDSVDINTRQRTLTVGSTRLIPQGDKTTFPQLPGNPGDWIEVEAGPIAFTGIDLSALLTQRTLRIDSISMNDIYVTSLKNRNIYQPPRFKKLLQESIQQLRLPIDVRTIHLKNINPTYQEIAEGSDRTGSVSFNGIDADFDGVTNIVSSPQQTMVLTARGKLMDSGLIDVVFTLPVDSSNTRFDVQGTLHAMDLTPLNKMIEPLARMEIKSASLKKMDFHIIGHKWESRTQMTLLYDDLDIAALKLRDGQYEERQGLSVIMNWVVKKSNPDNHGTRTADTTFKRVTDRSQFNYLWKSLFGGVKETIGVSRKR